jgi:hypothetical protein
LSSVYEKFPWKKDEKLSDKAGELLAKRQYENWVIFKFAQELANVDDVDIVFRGNEYPDAILIKRIGDEDFETLNVEFEEYSSEFKGHDPEKCDLIICCYHDWKEKYPNEKCPLPVYEISGETGKGKFYPKEE